MISGTQLKACISEWDTWGEDIDVRKDIGHSNHIDMKQQTMMSDGNGNKGQGFFTVSKQPHHHFHSWLNS